MFLVVAGVGVTFADWQMDGGRAPSPKKEKDLIAVLHSDAPKVKKADACKDLAVYGSKAAVPELAKLLTDEQLASSGANRLGSHSGTGIGEGPS